MSNPPVENVREVGQSPGAGDAWSEIAASLTQPGQRGPIGEQIASQSQRMQEQGLLGNITIATLGQNFQQIDQSGNGNGVIERADLQEYVRRQQTLPEAVRDNLALTGAQNALSYMDATRRESFTRDEVMAGMKDGMLPEMRDIRNAAKQHGGLVDLMRSINPDSVANGNQINIGSLRNAMETNPERFTKGQHLAARTLISDADNLANSVGLLNRIANFLWNGNDGRYVSPESITQRAHQLGTSTGIRPGR